jgi:acyl-CoA thioesterase-1
MEEIAIGYRQAWRKFIVVLGLAVGSLGVVTSSPAAAETSSASAPVTYGKGVSRDEAYPAARTAVRPEGYDASRKYHECQTSAILQRLEKSVPAGTSLVIFQPGGNDKRKGLGAERAENVSAIRERLSVRGIPVIMMENKVFRNYPRQADGQHLTVSGYRGLAQSLVSKVTKFLSK